MALPFSNRRRLYQMTSKQLIKPTAKLRDVQKYIILEILHQREHVLFALWDSL